MNFRESGMPDEKTWDNFLDTVRILSLMEINGGVNTLIDIGCGYGTFLFPASKVVKKAVGIDIDNKMFKYCRDRIKQNGYKNIEIVKGDISQKKTLKVLKLYSDHVDSVVLFNILHCEEPQKLLNIVYSILKPDGKAGVIHWKYDNTPRGPSMKIRPKPEKVIKWVESVGFFVRNQFELAPYHYGIVFEKEENNMKYGIILETKEYEKAWIAFRFAVASKKSEHEVKVFLMGEAVECEGLTHETYNIDEQLNLFVSEGGEILACGTCLKLRNMSGTEACPISTMVDCVKMVEWAEKTVTF